MKASKIQTRGDRTKIWLKVYDRLISRRLRLLTCKTIPKFKKASANIKNALEVVSPTEHSSPPHYPGLTALQKSSNQSSE